MRQLALAIALVALAAGRDDRVAPPADDHAAVEVAGPRIALALPPPAVASTMDRLARYSDADLRLFADLARAGVERTAEIDALVTGPRELAPARAEALRADLRLRVPLRRWLTALPR